MMMLPNIISGMLNRPMRNALVRTAARYSRRAMRRTLRTMHLRGRRAGDPDEDILQRRPRQLEQSDLAPIHQGREHGLRVGAAVQAQLMVTAEVGDLIDAGQPVERRAVAGQPDADGVLAVGVLDRF